MPPQPSHPLSKPSRPPSRHAPLSRSPSESKLSRSPSRHALLRAVTPPGPSPAAGGGRGRGGGLVPLLRPPCAASHLLRRVSSSPLAASKTRAPLLLLHSDIAFEMRLTSRGQQVDTAQMICCSICGSASAGRGSLTLRRCARAQAPPAVSACALAGNIQRARLPRRAPSVAPPRGQRIGLQWRPPQGLPTDSQALSASAGAPRCKRLRAGGEYPEGVPSTACPTSGAPEGATHWPAVAPPPGAAH